MTSGHVTASLTGAGGGVSSAVLSLAAALSDQGVGVSLAAIADGGTPLPWPPGIAGREFPPERSFPLRTSPALKQALVDSGADVFHIHGLWSYPSIAVPAVARRTRTPWIVSPHGMLDAWALDRSRLKKRVARILYEDSNLKGARCLHALCQAERQSIRSFGLKNPIGIIPNGVDLPALSAMNGSVAAPRVYSPKRLLFLGRLHPKKGLIDLLKAWKSLVGRGWQLVFAGWDQAGHEAELKHLAGALQIPWATAPIADSSDLPGRLNEVSSHSVVFVGAVFGSSKTSLLAASDAFILPSFSEGLPMAVLEAWAHRLPVVFTPECNLPEGPTEGAALEIKTNTSHRVSAIREALENLMEMSQSECVTMGAAGRRLVESRFTWPGVARQMAQVYSWVLGGGPKPDCVV